MQLVPIDTIRSILGGSRVIAVVGLSPNPARPSNRVASYMLRAGYCIIPVNPGHSEILGQKCYPNLRSVPQDIDIVDIFRRAEEVEPIVRDAIAVGARVVWMQQGIVNERAAGLAEQNGIVVVMDRCISVDYQSFML